MQISIGIFVDNNGKITLGNGVLKLVHIGEI